MAMQQLTLPGQIVKKHNELVRSRVNITSVQASRILASLIASIRADEKDFKTPYYLNIREFLPNDSGKSYAEIRAVCRELAKSFAEFEMEDPDGDLVLVEFPFFSRLIYKKGRLEALFNDVMRGSLLELRGQFTKYNLIDYLQLPTTYSQRIFEILKSWDDRPEVTITLESLHKTLNTPETSRKNFAEFRRYILEKAHKAIIEKTDLYFEWEPVKQGRAVVAVRFIFAKKRTLPVAEEKEKNELQKQNRKNTAIFKAVVACFKEHGPGCTGGHQKAEICEACKRLAGKEKSS